jgi:two-component system sensor histidine kinase KdpD
MSTQLSIRRAATWGFVLAGTTLVLLPFRTALDKAHVALVLLLVVLGAGAAGGRLLGLSIGAASFLVVDWFFLPPYNSLTLANPLDWLVLLAFLAASVIASQLLHREQESARRATARTAEVDRLAALGAEALNAPRAEDALAAVASVIRASTEVDACRVYLFGAGGARLGAASPPETVPVALPPLVGWVSLEGAPAAELEDGSTRLGARGDPFRDVNHAGGPPVRSLLLPLTVRGQTVGALHLQGERLATLDDARWRFLDALSYYAALGAERVQLAAAAAHADALREADHLKDALLASVSHDLRTPLTTIKALAHDLGSLGDERSQVIEEQADRLNRFVADLLDLSRLTAGAMPLHLELNAVDDLFSAALQEIEARLDGRSLDVRLPPDGELLVGTFDLALSIRVLVNLIENAYKYSSPGTPVTVAARREDARILISVMDAGPGVPPAEVERIFAPFYRPAGAPSDAGSIGLGLAIARRMAEAQGGAVSYAPHPRGGSVFTLSLPAADLPLRSSDAARAET